MSSFLYNLFDHSWQYAFSSNKFFRDPRSDALVIKSGIRTKVAKLAPQTSIDVRIKGADAFGYSASDGLSLIFERSSTGESCDPTEEEFPAPDEVPQDPR